MLKIVELHDRPIVSDIPGRLRWLADEIEAGRIDNVQSALIILGDDTGNPPFYQFGLTERFNNPFALSAMALHNFAAKLAE